VEFHILRIHCPQISLVLAQAGIMSAHAASERVESLERAISALESGEAGVETLKQLALTCLENTARDLLSSPLSPDVGLPSSPTPLSALRPLPSLHADIWEKNRTFDRFFKALLSYLQFTRVCFLICTVYWLSDPNLYFLERG